MLIIAQPVFYFEVYVVVNVVFHTNQWFHISNIEEEHKKKGTEPDKKMYCVGFTNQNSAMGVVPSMQSFIVVVSLLVTFWWRWESNEYKEFST